MYIYIYKYRKIVFNFSITSRDFTQTILRRHI